MSKPQERFVAVDPLGQVCGPCGYTSEAVMKALVGGYQRMSGDAVADKTHILRLGYTVRRCSITLLEGD